MAARLSAFVIWALVAAGLMFWGYRFWAPATALPSNLQFVADAAMQRGDLARLLGAAPETAASDDEPQTPAAESARFRLLGVLAPRPPRDANAAVPDGSGVALIAIDGKPPRAFVVGSPVDGELKLVGVTHRSASLGAAQGKGDMLLELPPLPPPATGTLARATAGGDAPRPAAPMPGGVGVPSGSAPVPGAAPGAAPRSPTFRPEAATPATAAAEAEDEEDTPTPVAQPRPGMPATR
jgi:general secretion pathway protein C